MWSMSGRPCNPGSDLRGLWQTLLGDMPFPQCGAPDQADAPQDRVSAASGKPSPEPARVLATGPER
jgi:hypothetical protein